MSQTIHLVIHGFGGNPSETQYLATYLRQRGLAVSQVLLAGHGGTKAHLKSSSPEHWAACVKKAAKEAARNHQKIVLIGFSMGGLLALRCAALPQVQKLVLLNTPLFFWNIKVILRDVLIGLRTGKRDKLEYYKKSMLGASLKSCIDFLKVLFHARKTLRPLTKPVLIAQCKNDETAHFKSAAYLKQHLGRQAACRVYPGGCHQVLAQASPLREQICGDVYRFLAP